MASRKMAPAVAGAAKYSDRNERLPSGVYSAIWLHFVTSALDALRPELTGIVCAAWIDMCKL